MNRYLIGFLALFLALTPAVMVHGAFDYGSAAPRSDIDSVDAVFTLLLKIANFMAWGLITVSAVIGIYIAFGYGFSGGDPEKVSGYNKALAYLVVAIVLALVVFNLPNALCLLLGCELPS